MKYTSQQLKYIDSVDGEAHSSAVELIGVMERALEAQAKMLVRYRLGSIKSPPESAFRAIENARAIGIKI